MTVLIDARLQSNLSELLHIFKRVARFTTELRSGTIFDIAPNQAPRGYPPSTSRNRSLSSLDLRASERRQVHFDTIPY